MCGTDRRYAATRSEGGGVGRRVAGPSTQRGVVCVTICLCDVRYWHNGAYAPISSPYALPTPVLTYRSLVLRGPCVPTLCPAVSGTDIAYAASSLRASYAVSGTDIARRAEGRERARTERVKEEGEAREDKVQQNKLCPPMLMNLVSSYATAMPCPLSSYAVAWYCKEAATICPVLT
eukprot:2736106-Rhodomonas_salina.1